MVDIARVNLYGQPVGTFRWDNNRQLAHFEYADSFIGKGLEPPDGATPWSENIQTITYIKNKYYANSMAA